MYKTYMELECRNHMREECKNAGASKSISDIYNEAVVKYVFNLNKVIQCTCIYYNAIFYHGINRRNKDQLCDGPFPIEF